MPEPSAVHPQTHRRSHARLRLGIAARVETLDGQQPVRLIDLSQSGAHVILSRPGEIRRGVLSWLGFEAFAFVVWTDGDRLGFEFDELVPVEHLIETRERAPTVVREESLGAEAAAREWVAGNLHQGSER